MSSQGMLIFAWLWGYVRGFWIVLHAMLQVMARNTS